MKTVKHIYDRLLDEDFIRKCIFKATKGKRKRRDVRKVLNNIPHTVNVIKETLGTDSFKPAVHYPKIIHEHGKERIIVKPKFFIESIVHVMVSELLKEIYMPKFYNYSCASVPGKGCLFGKKSVQKWINKIKRRHPGRKIYVLKLDIRKFFENVDRDVLIQLLSRNIRDTRFMKLLSVIIDCKEVNGLPLGFVTSQWLANIYLTFFDIFVKQNLSCEFYIRYMDDLVVLDIDKYRLHFIKSKIKIILNGMFHLDIKRNWQVFPISGFGITGRPLDFMGYKFYYDRITIRKSIIYKTRKTANKIKKTEIEHCHMHHILSAISRIGNLKHANTYNYYLTHIRPFVDYEFLTKIESTCSKGVILDDASILYIRERLNARRA